MLGYLVRWVSLLTGHYSQPRISNFVWGLLPQFHWGDLAWSEVGFELKTM